MVSCNSHNELEGVCRLGLSCMLADCRGGLLLSGGLHKQHIVVIHGTEQLDGRIVGSSDTVSSGRMKCIS